MCSGGGEELIFHLTSFRLGLNKGATGHNSFILQKNVSDNYLNKYFKTKTIPYMRGAAPSSNALFFTLKWDFLVRRSENDYSKKTVIELNKKFNQNKTLAQTATFVVRIVPLIYKICSFYCHSLLSFYGTLYI